MDVRKLEGRHWQTDRIASSIPLPVLAAVLAMVCWNMFERDAFATLLRASRGDAAVLLATFGITLFRGLTQGIVVSFALGSVLFIHRMSQTTALETHVPLVAEDDVADDASRPAYDETSPRDPTVVFTGSRAPSSPAQPPPSAWCSNASAISTAI